MDAIKYLRGEHSKFRRIFTSINKMTDEKKKKIKFKALCKDLIRHEKMEQKTWYPPLRKNLKLKKIISHLISEEKAAAKAIKKFNKSGGSGILWKIKFLKFKHDVNHHAKTEEKKLFLKVRQSYSKKELNDLGSKMKKFKSSLK